MTPEIYDHIVKETVRYATTYKNAMDFIMTSNELKAFIGVLLLSSYHKLPSERYYWSNDEDLGISLVKNALSRNRFQMLKSFIHFVDNSEAENNKHDKGFKIRPLYTMLQKSFIKFGIFEENLSIDEMIVRYYGHHSLKQFIPANQSVLDTNFGHYVEYQDTAIILTYIVVKQLTWKRTVVYCLVPK